ncbi:PilC/PilY family type IV pilus protein [Endozoicomonas sp. 8E]|uniref:pilus assembly protein n=1 Tax=Endozoicomonas sp. 8E TaxID=3035692 RepID=UPI0029390DB1|nr:PilC/PilY family type IV pilus protein [Endozoicomonas sp. 8E]WOG26431.1 PilC/PilY family type IV pilus protein [Endozoicomonas sp. 8E]
MKLKSINITLLTSLLLTTSTATWSDDTDIFLSNPNYDSSIKPNVLFILDNSGSMDWSLIDNYDAGYGEDSRLDVLKQSFGDIMANASDINAGLMKLHARSGESSRLTFPVTDIDALYGSDIILAGTPELLESTDDATEDLTTGTVTTSSNTLILGVESNSAISNQEQTYQLQNHYDSPEGLISDGSIWYNTSYYSFYDTQLNGLYFRNLNIPFNAIIEEAHIRFRSTYDTDEFVEIKIDAELAKNPQPMGPGQSNFGNRPRTSASHVWEPGDWSSNTNGVTDDISSVIQSILNDASLNWMAGEKLNNLSLFMEVIGGTPNDRHIFKEQSNGSYKNYAPRLYIKYSVPESTVEKVTGVRFQSVGIPAGSTINSAKIEFTSTENSSEPISLNVFAGKPTGNNNNSFSQNNQNLSSREKYGPITWTPGAWSAGTSEDPSVHGVDVTSLLQEVVNDSNWCGNDNSTFYVSKSSGSGKRTAYSIDGNNAKKPRLVVQFTPPANGTGCITSIINTRINGSDQDAYEWNSDGGIYLYNNEIRMGGNSSTYSTGGLHYPRLPLKKNATILEAYLELTSHNNNSGNMSIRIQAEDQDTSSAFVSGYRNITYRNNLTSASVDWSIQENWITGITYRSPDIKDVITEVISRNGWQAGNNLTLILKATGGERYAKSYDNSPSSSPRLIVKVADGGIDTSAGYRVKDHLVSLVENMSAGGGTPIVPSMYNAANYYTSAFRGNQTPIVNSCQSNHLVLLTDGQANSNTSTAVDGIASLIGQTCSGDAYNDGEKCGRSLAKWMATNDLVDTVESVNTVTTHTIAFATQADQNAKQFMQNLAYQGRDRTKPDSEVGYYEAKNAQDLANAFNDIVNGILDKESTFAAPGVAANSFNQSRHLNKIFYSVFKPSLTDRWIGNLKKYQLLTDNNDSTEIYDGSTPPLPAIDQETGFFNDASKSFWSATQDGKNVDEGGAASRFNSADNRKIFTYIGQNPAGTSVSIAADNQQLKITNSNLTPDLFGLNNADVARKNELINWLRNPNTWMGDPLHSRPALANYRCRNQTVDNLYSCSEDNLELALFIGSNDGMFHAFNTTPISGQEQNMEYFSFIPQELLPILDTLEENNTTSRIPGQQGRPYGLDGDITLWTNDVNGNGVIYGGADTMDYDNDSDTLLIPSDTLNPNEFVYAYVGMRRGGRNYYALDVTDLSTPEMLWFIRGGEGNFSRLGQTWSKPIKAKIRIGKSVDSSIDNKVSSNLTETIDVLVFSGGYDNSQDASAIYKADTMGNAIYIVDASTGELLWHVSPDNTASLKLNKMQYSIPGGVSLADLQGDGFPDQILFGDTGGQLWRLYLNQCIPISNDNGEYSNDHCAVTSRSELGNLVWPSDSDGNGIWDNDDGVMAYIGYPTAQDTSQSIQTDNARKFYTRPDITTFGRNGRLNIGIAMGSGKRSDPLGRINQHTEDRFFFITSEESYNPSFSSDSSDDNYKSKRSVPKHTMYNVNNNDLIEISYSQNSDGDYVTSVPTGSDTLQKGWYLSMSTIPGLHEKVLSDPTIYNSEIYFSSFTPEADATNTCSAVTGRSWAWKTSLDGQVIDRDRINTNGIVDASVFIRLAKDESSDSEPSPQPDGGTPPPGGGTNPTPDGENPSPDGENPDPDSEENPSSENDSTCLMFNGTDGEEVACPNFEGSSYWRQVR